MADFYCYRALLVIEPDGGIQDKKEQRGKDYRRDQIINSLGLKVLRIRNEERFDIPAVLEKISAALKNLKKPAHKSDKSHNFKYIQQPRRCYTPPCFREGQGWVQLRRAGITTTTVRQAGAAAGTASTPGRDRLATDEATPFAPATKYNLVG